MNDNEINAAIAEACGWRKTKHWSKSMGEYYLWSCSNPPSRRASPPNYVSDLNAMHEAEKMLTKEELVFGGAYETELRNARPFEPWLATAKQRAGAYLRTMEKRKKGGSK